MLLTHAQPFVLIAVIAADIARLVTDAPAVVLIHGAALGATALAFFADHYHQHRLCLRCAAATPLDGPAAAKRHHRWLRLHHWAAERFGYPLILIAAAVAYLGLDAPHWVTYYPVYVLWALIAYANLRHRPVEPWCPQCRRWGWDTDDDTDPVPPPVPAAGTNRWIQQTSAQDHLTAGSHGRTALTTETARRPGVCLSIRTSSKPAARH